jgi:hypothetical protein
LLLIGGIPVYVIAERRQAPAVSSVTRANGTIDT